MMSSLRVTVADVPPSAPRSGKRIGLAIALSLAMVLGVAWQSSKIDWATAWDELRQSNLTWFIAGVFVFYAGFLVRCVRWQVLLRNAGRHDDRLRFPQLVSIMYRSWFVNTVTIARAGDAYRGFLLKRETNASIPHTIGTVLAERIVDMFVLALLLFAAVGVAIHDQLDSGGYWVLSAAGAVVVGVIALMLVLARLSQERAQRRIPARFQEPAARVVEGVVAAGRRLPLLCGLTVIGWLGECLMLLAVAHAVGAPVSLSLALMVALVTALLATIPVTPAGLGVADIGIVVLLTRNGLDPAAATAIAVLSRTISIGTVIAGGGLLTLIATMRSRRIQ